MMAFLHLYLKYSQPLFVQGIMAFKSLYEAKTVKIHVFGQASEGDLKRPFKGAGGMFGGACLYLIIHNRTSSHRISRSRSFCGTADGQGCHRRGRKTHRRQEGGVRRHAAQQGIRLAIIYFLLFIYSFIPCNPCVICTPGRDSNWEAHATLSIFHAMSKWGWTRARGSPSSRDFHVHSVFSIW